jgi:hypothetical protein
MLASARVLIKPYRFEVGIAAIAALVAGIAALIVTYRLVSIPMPAGCFEAWVQAPGYDYAADCEHATFVSQSIDANEVGPVFGVLAVIPFVIGLIGGVPIVARELEMGTAQTTWSLWPSRTRWLSRKLLAVLTLLGVSIGIAALSGSLLGATQPGQDILHSTGQGPILVARALAAFGIGVFVGAAFGRSLPAFLIAAVLCGVLGWAAEESRFAWLMEHRVVIAEGPVPNFQEWGFGYAWRTPEGEFIPWVDDVIYQRVPPEFMDATEDPDSGPEAWLYAHGYELWRYGVTDETVHAWVPLEVAAMSLIGLIGFGGTAVAVNRRRPT